MANTQKGRPTAAKKEKMKRLFALLEGLYPKAECALQYGGDPYRLLVMGRLSAQCTDARVNLVAPAFFERYPTVFDLAEADSAEVEGYIRSCGLYRAKARDLVGAAQALCLRFGGILPSDMDLLLSLPGVGRKIANLLRGDLFGLPAVVADTHCIRLSARLGFTPKGCRDPLLTERTLTPLLEGMNSSDFCHRLVFFGREVCTAKNPACHTCPVKEAGLCQGGEKGKA